MKSFYVLLSGARSLVYAVVILTYDNLLISLFDGFLNKLGRKGTFDCKTILVPKVLLFAGLLLNIDWLDHTNSIQTFQPVINLTQRV